MDLPMTLTEILELLRSDQTAWLRLSPGQRAEVLSLCRDSS